MQEGLRSGKSAVLDEEQSNDSDSKFRGLSGGFHLSCAPWSFYLDPRPSVVFSGGPGVDQTLPVEPREVGVPLLQAEQSAVGGGGCYLLVGDYTALHSQRSRAL